MTSSKLKLEQIGATHALLSWDNEGDGAVYEVDILDDESNTLRSSETQDTSLAIVDLTPQTSYIFKLFKQVVPEYEYYTNIRIDHLADKYLALVEVWPFDTGGYIVPGEMFEITSSSTHPNAKNREDAMNGKSNVNQYTNGVLLLAKSNMMGAPTYWEAQAYSPVQLSGIRLYTYTQYSFASDSTLTMTKANGETVQYSLSESNWQQIQFPKV